jgi:hypothetical protein
MLMIRRVGTRATYTTSLPSRTEIEEDSLTRATRASMWGWETSGRVRLDRYA